MLILQFAVLFFVAIALAGGVYVTLREAFGRNERGR